MADGSLRDPTPAAGQPLAKSPREGPDWPAVEPSEPWAGRPWRDWVTLKLGPGTILGVVIALAVPISFLIVALLVKIGAVSFRYQLPRGLVDLLQVWSYSEVLLGPIGIAIAGSSAGVRSRPAWIVLFLFSVPLLAVAWFGCGWVLYFAAVT